MGYFPTPIAVKPLPDSDAIRISVRASEARIDEWTILRHDVESVLDGYDDEYTGWRGVGELRVRMGRSGGDVAFYDGDDRALLRLSISEVASFMAHLRACMYELEGSVRLPPPASHRSAYASASASASACAWASINLRAQQRGRVLGFARNSLPGEQSRINLQLRYSIVICR